MSKLAFSLYFLDGQARWFVAMRGMKKTRDGDASPDRIAPCFQFLQLVTTLQYKRLVESRHTEREKALEFFDLTFRDDFHLGSRETRVTNCLCDLGRIERTI